MHTFGEVQVPLFAHAVVQIAGEQDVSVRKSEMERENKSERERERRGE